MEDYDAAGQAHQTDLLRQQELEEALEVNGEVIRPTRAYYVKINKG
jgi:hypothetical protein